MKSLFNLTLNSLCHYFWAWKEPSIEHTQETLVKQIREFQQYNAIAAPLLPLLIEHCYTNTFHYEVKSIYAYFLPIYIRNRKLDVLKKSAKLITQLITKSDLFDTETLDKVTEINFIRENFIKDGLFLMKFPRLEVLVLDVRLDDLIVEAIVRHFPELRVLDCCTRDVYCSIVTDRGLEKLAHLKKLKFVLLDNRDDEDEYDDDNIDAFHPSQFTGKGVADLIKALPQLERFVCPGFIMKEALQILKLSQTTLATVKSIYLSGNNVLVDSFVTAKEVCPNLERICISTDDEEEEESQVIEALNSFPHIKQLHFYLSGTITNFDGIGQKLSILELHQDVFEFENLTLMGAHCLNVKVLSLKGGEVNVSSFDAQRLNSIRSSLFPSLDTLVYDIRNIRGVDIFLHKDSGLLHFHYPCAWHSNSANTLKDLLERLVPDCGLWPHLNTFGINKVSYNWSLVTQVAEALPSLERVIMRVGPSSDKLTYISSRGQCVTVFGDNRIVISSFYPVMGFPEPEKMCWR